MAQHCLTVAALGRGSCCIERAISLDFSLGNQTSLEAGQHSSGIGLGAMRKQPNKAAARPSSGSEGSISMTAMAALLPHMDPGGQASGDGPASKQDSWNRCIGT